MLALVPSEPLVTQGGNLALFLFTLHHYNIIVINVSIFFPCT